MSQVKSRRLQYPPLLPALVAAHQLALGTSDPERVGHALRITYAILYVLYVVFVYKLCRRYLEPLCSFLAAVLAALPVHVVFLSDILFAELPYGLLTVLFAYQVSGSVKDGVGRWRHVIGSAAIAAAAFLTRSSGLALLGAWVAESAVERRWKLTLVRGVAAILPVLAWQAYVVHVTSSESYRHPAYEYQRAPYLFYNVSYGENARLVNPFEPELGTASAAVLARRFAANAASMPAVLGRALFTGKAVNDADGVFTTLPYTFNGLLILAGLAALARRGFVLIPLYIAFSLALICTTPWPAQFGRYMAPLVPFVALALVYLLRTTAEQLPVPAVARTIPVRSWLVTAAASVLIAKQAYSVMRVNMDRAGREILGRSEREVPDARFFFFTPPWAKYDEALNWLKSHASDGEVVATSAPQQAFLATGLKAVMFPFELDPGKAQRLVDRVPVRYLIREELDIRDICGRYATPVLEAYPELWERVYGSSDGMTVIYRRNEVPMPSSHSTR